MRIKAFQVRSAAAEELPLQVKFHASTTPAVNFLKILHVKLAPQDPYRNLPEPVQHPIH